LPNFFDSKLKSIELKGDNNFIYSKNEGIAVHAKHNLYPIWLRFFALAGAFTAFLLVSPPFFKGSDKNLPWNDQKCIWKSNKTPHFKLSENRPQLNNVIRYIANVERDNQICGKINIIISPEGTIKGLWTGEFDKTEDIDCSIMAASFSGNIVPDRQYIEAGEQDASKLYFFTAGGYNFFETKMPEKKQSDGSGFLYVRGWIDSSYTASGELIITEDKKSFEIFSWFASPVEE